MLLLLNVALGVLKPGRVKRGAVPTRDSRPQAPTSLPQEPRWEAKMLERMKRRFGDRVEGRVVAVGFDRVKHVHPVRPEAATGLVSAVYEQLARDFQLVAPLTLTSPLPSLLAASWTLVRETLVTGAVPRLEKELVALGVSKANACPYCVSAHALMLRGRAQAEVAKAMAQGEVEAIANSRFRALGVWALNSRSPDHPAVVGPPFDARSAPEFVGTAVAFHAINRMVDIFLEADPLDMPMGLKWAAELLTKPVAATFGRRMVDLTPRPGESLTLLPPALLPADLQWAEPNPVVAGAVARAAAVTEQLGATLVPDEARTVVLEHVSRWRGEAMGPSRAWVEEAIGPVAPRARPAARLGLLAALASFQIDEGVVRAFREQSASDQALLGTAAWAAFTAARRAGTWLGGLGTSSVARAGVTSARENGRRSA
jgi:AhpD family alkylhydroperoxidase